MYAGMADPDRWVLLEALAEHANMQRDTVWVTTTEGEHLTFGQAWDDAERVAGFFAELGIRAGDRVALMLPNGCDFIRAWLGLGRLGAVAVLLNTELRGAFLQHQLSNSGVELAIIDSEFVAALHDIDLGDLALRRALVIGKNPVPTHVGMALIDWAGWKTAESFNGPMPSARDIACIMYTSGTSGPSKGVLMPHAHCALYGIGAIEAFQLRPGDRYYIVLPLCHANGLLMQLGASLLAGIPAVLRPRFSASAWLPDIREHGATVTNLLGALAAFIVAQPASPDDRAHSLRALLNGPNLPIHEAAFRERFGVQDVLSGFGMTEMNIPIWGRLGMSRPGAAGWVHTRHFEVIVADPETDRELPRGELGEILVRPRVPFGFMAGYHGRADKTVEAWRNLWFHTGDAGTMQSDGLVTFVDRMKDCIRRRGENIAATEVEAVVAGLPGVAEVAAFAVPSDVPGGEDELMLAIVGVPGAVVSLVTIGDRVERLLPRFARPRFLELVLELPKTSTGKVQRALLRRRGSSNALDRDQAAKCTR